MNSTAVPFHRTKASALLDLVRGLAAIVVCLEHWRSLFFVDYGQIPHHRAWFAIPYALTGAGHQAVVIFFVLSGYLVGGSIFRLFERDRWSWKLYLTHRLVRLWVVLLPALLLCWLLDFTGIHSHGAPALYAGQVKNHILDNVSRSLNFTSFVGNLVFLQGIVVHTFGSDGPLWSLANEFWYYVLFPCVALLWRSTSSWSARAVSGLLFLAAAVVAGKTILLLFPVWLLGALLAVTPPGRISTAVRTLIAAAYVPLFFFLAKAHFINSLLSDYVLSGATFLLLWSFLGARSEAGNSVWVWFARHTARFSYTLYLVHVPFLVLMAARTVHDTRWTISVRHAGYAAGILAAALMYAYLVASLTEFRTGKVRNWVEVRVMRTPERDLAAISN